MRRNVLAILVIALFLARLGHAVLPNGSDFVDFIVTDINGVEINTADIRAQGKMIVLDCFATWCGPCWNYHQSHQLENLYQQYGPEGTDELVVIALEVDLGTAEACIYGPSGCNGTTQGDWTVGISYSIVSVEDPSIPNNLNITYYPTIYTVCPDAKIYESGQVNINQHAGWLNSCSFEAFVNNVQNVSCFEDQDGAIDAGHDGGNSPISFSWSNGASSEDIYGLAAGLYSVTMTEGNGRSVAINDVFVDGPTEGLQLFVDDVGHITCFGDGDGYIEVSSGGGTPGYSYQWSTGQNSEDIYDLAGGAYTLTVTDLNGCVKEIGATVNEPPELTLALDIEDENCSNQDGIIICTAGGGSGSYSYDIGEGPVPINVFAGLAQGQYSITVTDLYDCAEQEQAVVGFVPAPDGDAGPYKELSCSEPTIQLEGDGPTSSNIDIEWTTPDGNIVDGGNTLTPTVDAEGVYNLKITDTDNDCFFEDFTVVTLDPNAPTADAGDDKTIDCNNTSAVLDGSNSVGNDLTFQWTSTDGNIVDGGDTPTPTVDAAGTYTLQVENSEGCTSVSSAVVAADLEQPTAEIESPEAINCLASQVQLDGSASAAGPDITYAWSTADGNIVDGGNTNTATVDAGGTYSLTVLNTINGCTAMSQTTVAENTEIPEVAAGEDKLLTCTVSQLTLDGSGTSGSGDISYSWDSQDGNIVDGQDSPSPTVDQEGIYSLTVLDPANGCQAVDEVVVQVDREAPVIDAGGDKILTCQESSLTLDGSASGNGDDFVVEWTTQDGHIAEGGDGVTPLVDQPGTYVMNVTDMSNGCAAVDEVVVDIDADVPAAHAGEPAELTCLVTSVALDGSASDLGDNITYEWTTQDGNIVEGAQGLTPVVDAPGTYSLRVTDEDNNCSSVASVEITEFINTPVAEFEYEMDGLEIAFQQIAEGNPVSYHWEFGDGGESDEPDPEYAYEQAGTYNVCLTIENECGTNTFCEEVQAVTSTILFETDIKHVSCHGGDDGSIRVDVTVGTEPITYNWSNGAEGADNESLTAGTYQLTITDDAGNSVEQEYTIDEPDLIELVSSEITDQTSTQQGAIDLEITGGVPPYTYEWNNGADSPDLINLEAGDYTLTVTDENGCEMLFGPFAVEDLTGINEIASLTGFTLYPNPMSEYAILDLRFEREMSFTVRLRNVEGRVVFQNRFETDCLHYELKSVTVPGGMYIVEIECEEGLATKQLIIR